MAVPVATATVVGGPIDITDAVREGTVTITDTADPYTPAATGRSVKVGAATVDAGPQDVVSTLNMAAAGTYPVSINVVNADGNDDSTPVNVVVTDDLADTPPATFTPTGGAPRVLQANLPAEYKDGTLATPGMPTVSGVNAARYFGSVGAIGATDGIVVLDDGSPVVVDLS